MYKTHSTETTFYTEYILDVPVNDDAANGHVQNTFYREQIMERTHSNTGR